MAEGDGLVFNNFKEQILLGELDLVDDTIKMALIDATWTPVIDGDISYTTVSGDEMPNGNGYTTGGETLSNKAVTQDDGNDWAYFDNTVDITWTALDTGVSINRAFLYDDTHASKWAIAMWEIATDSNGGNYSLSPHAEGLVKIA